MGETEAGRAPSVLPRVPPLRGGLRQVEALQATIPAPYKRGQGEHRLGRSPPTPKSLRLLPTSTHSTSSSTKTHLRSMPPPPWVASTIPDAGPSASCPVPARPGRGVTGPRSLALQDREGGGQGRAGQPGEGADSGRTLPPPRPRRAEKRGAVKSPGGGIHSDSLPPPPFLSLSVSVSLPALCLSPSPESLGSLSEDRCCGC